jgi:hypothetical protein
VSAQQNDYAYSGLHAFAFITSAGGDRTVPELVASLREMMESAPPKVLIATEVAGPYRAFAHLRGEDLDDLQDFLASDVWDGVEFRLATEGPFYETAAGQLMGASRTHTPPPVSPYIEVVAFVRVWVNAGDARPVLGRLGDGLGPAFKGASIVFGDFDILLVMKGRTDGDEPEELGSSFATVAQAAVDVVQQVDGITRTETAYADLGRYSGSTGAAT